MRGKQRDKKQRNGGLRITPADAGKTEFEDTYNQLQQDHPRGCGENRVNCGDDSTCMGSPPRMRGKHPSKGATATITGITPADAGKTIKII